MNGARWVQKNLLEPVPKADVRVFVVWFKMYPGDAENQWRSEALPDARAEHRWDEPKSAGRWFLEHLSEMKPTRGGDGVFPQRVDAMWDTYLLFDANATWTDRPTSIVSWGYTVMRTRDRLQKDFDYVIAARPTTVP